MSMSYFITSIGSGVLLANNWQRLGKPTWVQPTRIAAILLPLLSLAIIIGVLIIITNSSDQAGLAWLIMLAFFTAFGLNFGMMIALVTMQRPIYKLWKNNDFAPFNNYPFNARRGLTIFAIFLGGSILLGAVLSFLTTRPNY